MESPKTGSAKANRSKQILFIAVSVFVLCIICAAIGVLFQSIVDDSTPEVASQPKQTEVAPTPTIMKESAAENTPAPEPPTPTPIPTDTPTPAPPTPTLEPEARLRLALEETLGASNREMEKRITGFINTNGELYIEWNINDNITENMVKGGARLDVKSILEVVAEIGPDFNYTGIIINGTFPLVDSFGNTKEELVVDAFYNRSTIEKINFSNFLTDNVYVIADKLYIHPAFQE